MPRRYYSRRTKVVRPRKRWATNFATVGGRTSKSVNMTAGQVSTITYDHTLVENTAQTSNPTPVMVKAGNFKVKGDMKITMSLTAGTQQPSLVSCVVYIVYVPEGMSPVSSIITNHPEWIIAWSPVNFNMDYVTSSSTSQNVEKFSFSSRLKRNLNSGDRITCMTVFNFQAGANSTSSETINMTFAPAILCQYWTCSN